MNEQNLYSLFHDCTAELATPSDRGTGFFVAPQLLLTCYHVVKETDAEKIEIRWRDRTFKVMEVERREKSDLALLHVDIEEHPCALLSREVLPWDRLYAYGYPTDAIGSNSALCQCEGINKEGTILNLVSDSIRYGFSGSPLLNKRTLKVCGVVVRDLAIRLQGNTERAFGGKAIPMELVFKNWPELEEKNSKYYQEHSTWGQFLPTDAPPNNLRRSYAPHFVGRVRDLQTLHEQLQRGDRVAISTVTGMGGIGKTELAVQYALRYWQEFYRGGVCWLGARDEDVGLGILNYGRSLLGLNPPEDLPLESRVAYCWRNWGGEGDVLAILDDVVNFDAIEPFLPRNDSRFKVVVTTRLQSLAGTFERLELQVLELEEALELLRRFIGERVDREMEEAKALCEWLGCLPLGLELVGQYLRQKDELSLVKMRERLEKKRLEQRALLKPTERTTAQIGIKAAFELSWQELDEEAQEVACLLSLFAVAPFPWELVKACFSEKDEEDLEDIRDDVLVQWSLLQKLENGYFELHSLLQKFMRNKLAEKEYADELKGNFCQVQMRVAQQISKTPTLEEIERFTLIIPHLAEVAEVLLNWVQDEDLIWAFFGLGFYYNGQGLYHQALFWFEMCLSVTQTRLGKEHSDVTTALNNLAQIHESQGNYEKAKSLHSQSLELRQKLSGENHQDVAISLNNLARVYQFQGHYSKAELLFVRALEIMRSLHLENHPHFINVQNNLAALYQSQGRYEQSELLYIETLELSKQFVGENHPHFATSLNNLAHIYHIQGHYEKAEPLFIQALNLRRKLLGENHPDSASSLNNLAEIYHAQGHYEKAESLFIQALDQKRNFLGENHPDIAISLNNLAGLYKSQLRYEEAEFLLVEALELRKRFLGKNHPYYIQSLNNLANIYYSQGRYEKAEPLLNKALELGKKIFGENHPDIATFLNNLAGLYQVQSYYKKVEPLLIQALKLRKSFFGENHPDVAISLNNLAGLYQFQSRYEEAEDLSLEALQIAIRKLGQNHPQTRTMINNFIFFLQQVIRDNRESELSDNPLTQNLLAQLKNQS